MVRQVLGENGKIPLPEYNNAQNMLLDFAKKTPQERAALIQNMKDVLEQQRQTHLGTLKMFGDQYHDTQFVDKLGLAQYTSQAPSPITSPHDELLKKWGGVPQ